MEKKRMPSWLMPVVCGIAIGIAALVLSAMGNPGNMGFCIACFYRDIAGTLGLHNAAVVQYFRPEIAGIILGACLSALAFKEFKGKGGSAPALRFLLGAFMMIGALVFLGCPLRMLLRLGGGDWNALVGLLGFAVGIGIGVLFLKKGYTLGRAYDQPLAEGFAFPIVMVVLFVCSIVFTTAFRLSESGPGSMHAPVIISLIAGLVVGVLCQRSRFCMGAGIRNAVMFRDFALLLGFAALFVTVLLGNLILGKFKPGFTGQPVAHNDGLWNFLGMTLVGWCAILLGGCPLRQTILAAEGNSDSALTVVGMIAGAAFSHNFGLAGKAGLLAEGAGASPAGKTAVIIGLVVALLVSIIHSQMLKKEA